MLENEPLSFPSRHTYPMNPAVPDRQLWAIGMVVVQWSMVEFLVMQHVRDLSKGKTTVLQELNEARNFKQIVQVWREQFDHLPPDENARLQNLSERVLNLSAQRNELIHRAWGGGMQQGSWSAEGFDTTDAKLLKKPGDRIDPNGGAKSTISWDLTFNGIRKIAVQIAQLNSELMMIAT